MLTAAELRAIVERHAGWEAPAGHANPLDAARHMSRFAAAAQADRGALLDLLRAVAKVDWTAYGRCIVCDSADPEGHGPDCPAPALEALREER